MDNAIFAIFELIVRESRAIARDCVKFHAKMALSI